MRCGVSAACVSAVLAVACLAADPLPAFGTTSIGNREYVGERSGGTRLKFPAGDSVMAQVDVGSGNLLVSVKGLTLVGVGTKIQTGAFYNSLATPDLDGHRRLGVGWGLDYTPDVNVRPNTDGSVTYTGPSGLTGLFTLKSGSTTAYTAPQGITVDLTKTSTGWTMKDHQSQAQQKFNADGELVSRQDRDSNVTEVDDVGAGEDFRNVDVVTPAGPAAARTVQVRTGTDGVTTMTQAAGGPAARQVAFHRNGGNLTEFDDALGRKTSLWYDGHNRPVLIDGPGNNGIEISYDSAGRVSSVLQGGNYSIYATDDAVTRFSYPSATEVQVADPSTDQAQPVSAVPRTTYTVNGSKRVEKAVDPEGRTVSKTYQPVNQATATGAVDPSGAAASKITNTYGANGGESLTKSTTNGGLEMTMSYANTSGPGQYQPTGGKDAGNVSQTYEYSGTGNQLSTTGQGGTEKSSLDYNSDGTVSAAASPKDAANKTLYGYNTDKQLTKITPKTGSSLGEQDLTYDEYGRVKTATNGRGITITYSYDKLDRLTATTFSDGMTVGYGYDTAGRQNTRTDPHGVTTYTYDAIDRLTSRTNTAGGGTFSYTYNRAGWLTSSTSATGGTVSYAYDKSGKPTSVTYPYSGSTKKMLFATDSHGRRTEAWLGANADHTSWVAHYKYSYDKNDQVTRVLAEQGSGNTSNTDVVDISYCYKQKYNATTAPNGIPVGGDCSQDDAATVPAYTKVQWEKNNETGVTTEYSYKQNGKINQVRISGNSASIDYDYAYDGNGNRKEADHNTSSTATALTDLTFNPENQITNSGYVYDGTGNITAKPGLPSITYTAADQLASVTRSNTNTTYTYKHAGADNRELLEQTTPEGTYSYAYGRTNQVGVPMIETLTKDGQTANVINDPVTGQPLMLRSSTGMQSMYIYDAAPGSPVALITSAAQEGFAAEYDPYGLPTVTADNGGVELGQNPFGFAGGIKDRTTNWVHYGNRYYDPRIGTWTQRDTLDDPLSPLNANRYAYAGGDPINNIDPTGLRGCAGSIGLAALATFSYFGGGAALIIATGGLGIGLGAALFVAGAIALPYSYQDAVGACQ